MYTDVSLNLAKYGNIYEKICILCVLYTIFGADGTKFLQTKQKF